MKCKYCKCAVLGYFNHLKEKYVCVGVKEPFVISDYENAECTEYKSWYDKTDLSSIIRISESDDFIVDYDKSRGMYRVSVFDDGHFWDEFWFDAYEDKEVDDKIDKIIEKLEVVKKDFSDCLTERHRVLNSSSFEYFCNELIKYIKNVKETK